jgi:hypothetical protein
VRRFVEQLLTDIKEWYQDYSAQPPPPGSKYVRTFTLHDSWDTEVRV